MLPFFALILNWTLQPCLAASPIHIPEASCPSTTLLEPRVCGLHNDNPSAKTEPPSSDDISITTSLESHWTGPSDCVRLFCIYSNPSYAGGRGLVIVTKSWYTKSIQQIVHVSNDADEPESELYRVEEIPGKGLGLVATRRLERGEALMREAPIFIVHTDVLRRAAAGPGPIRDLLDLGFRRLPPAARDLLLRETQTSARSKCHRLIDMLATNGYDVGLQGFSGTGPHVGLYPAVSRLNHDCRPNLAYRTDSSLVHRNRVARTVLPGQELTVSYLDPFLPRRHRRAQTRRHWGFECECRLCSLPGMLALEGDRRLRRIRQLELDMSSWDSMVSIDDVRELVRGYEEERLDIKIALPLAVAAENANALGYDEEARAYAARAIEAGLLEMEMEEGGSLRTMRAILEDAKGHYTYRKRVKI